MYVSECCNLTKHCFGAMQLFALSLSISGAATNDVCQRRNHCCGAMLLLAVFLSIYGAGTNDAFRVKAVVTLWARTVVASGPTLWIGTRVAKTRTTKEERGVIIVTQR